MHDVVYTIMGDPIPLARARFSKKSDMVYDPQKILKKKVYYEIYRQFKLYSQDMHCRSVIVPHVPYVGPYHLDVTFFMQIPRRLLKDFYNGKVKYHYVKPDLDNCLKFIGDVISTNALLLQDDCLISSISTKKVYDLTPRTEFRLVELHENEKEENRV
jgi:Holliday junction resolvase RusA-like endonuclease